MDRTPCRTAQNKPIEGAEMVGNYHRTWGAGWNYAYWNFLLNWCLSFGNYQRQRRRRIITGLITSWCARVNRENFVVSSPVILIDSLMDSVNGRIVTMRIKSGTCVYHRQMEISTTAQEHQTQPRQRARERVVPRMSVAEINHACSTILDSEIPTRFVRPNINDWWRDNRYCRRLQKLAPIMDPHLVLRITGRLIN